jgi:hypothetical protein
MARTILKHYPDSTDPRLGRNVNHDSESRRYAVDTAALQVVSVRWLRTIGPLDQGNVGSCTGNAGVGAIATVPFADDTPFAPTETYSLDEDGALELYSDAEDIDGDGPYPPNDNGSSGLSIAKALKNAGYISGYQHTFSKDDALKALQVAPGIFGTNWYESMFDTDADGRLRISGKVAGGHEVEIREVDAEKEQVWIDNSWGGAWGVQGRAYLTFGDYERLLNELGDMVFFVPLAKPAPTPGPEPTPTPTPDPTPTPTPTPEDPDAALEVVARPWALRRHYMGNRDMWHATQAWLASRPSE